MMPVVIKVQGPALESDVGHGSPLISQLKKFQKDAQILHIEQDTPSNTEWSILGDYFTRVRILKTDSGHREDLNDEAIPPHWPLEHLEIGSAATGNTVKTPFVCDGRVPHLVLFLTYGLRFKSDGSDGETSDACDWRIEDEESSQCIVDELASKLTAQQKIDDEVKHTKLRKFEILENDAIATFVRMATSLPHVVINLTTLNLRSTLDNDFRNGEYDIFQGVLPYFVQLQTLVLSIGGQIGDERLMSTLCESLPPNLSTFRFRGPISLVTSERWPEFVKLIGSSEFLPRLKELSFVLDLAYKPKPSEWKLTRATDIKINEAKMACSQLYDSAISRNVAVSQFMDKWADSCTLFKEVDSRWSK
ncbi:hypothetical protein F5884DRAFT_172743 [Xylogone sp. PMI_703]|nr:hypothetical protein F5884DRAFT_172743 [Xylogone sp. PMI_703]